MMWNTRNPDSQKYRVRVRETDDYLERLSQAQKQPSKDPSGAAGLFQPLVVGVMVACISWSVFRFIRTMAPDWDAMLFLVGPVITALVGFTTYRSVQNRFISGSDRMRFMAFEWLVMFIVVKFAGHFDDTVPEFLATAQAWFEEPALFFDFQTIVAFIFVFLGWGAAHLTARDLQEIREPTAYDGESGPARRLVLRFFMGGVILLVFTALNRVEFIALLETGTPRVPGLILNVLVYFVSGLVIFAQLRYTRMSGAWEAQRVKVSGEVRSRWLRYSLVFIAVAALISFLLPTGYTIGFLDMVAFIVLVVSYVMWGLVLLLTMPLAWLLSLLFKTGPVEPLVDAPSAPLVLPSETVAGAAHPWWLMVRSLLFWILAIAGLVYVLRGYVRDRPELAAALKRFGSLRWVAGLASLLRRWWMGLRHSVETGLPRVVARLRRARLLGLAPGRTRSADQSLRERIFDHYLDTLQVAQGEGVPRRDSQTPYEYEQVLEPRVGDAAPAWDDLTSVFVEARYSRHPLEEGTVRRIEREASEVQDALRRREDAPHGS